MNHAQFFEYHNRHIKFYYLPPSNYIEELTGVVLDIINYNEKISPTEYIFVPTNRLLEWKQADNEGDTITKERIQRRIDISYITSAELIKP